MIPADIRSLRSKAKEQLDEVLRREKVVIEETIGNLKEKRLEELRRKFNNA